MNHNIIAIVGPTASGKTALSVRLAQELGGEIVSFDSMQLYRGMDIGTATPTQEEMAGVPHHMINIADPAEAYSVSRYVNQADPIIQELLASGKPVILVGGTGLYVDSLVAGREFAPFPETGLREELMDKAEKEGILPLYEALCLIDPEAGAAIHPSNHKRVIRAMEVYLETGKTISQHNRESREKPPKYQPLWIGLDYVNREALYSRINRRVEKMFAEGLVQEVQGLLEQGIPAEATAMQAIGYKELVSHLRGETTEDEAKEAIALASRRYAKRQRTWFRRNEAVHWLELPDEPNLDEIFLSARQILRDSPK